MDDYLHKARCWANGLETEYYGYGQARIRILELMDYLDARPDGMDEFTFLYEALDEGQTAIFSAIERLKEEERREFRSA